MKYGKCPLCGKRNYLHIHHKFSKNKLNKTFYGSLIHDTRNLQIICQDCHLNKQPGIIIWTELQFCEALGIVPRSYTAKTIYKRLKNGRG